MIFYCLKSLNDELIGARVSLRGEEVRVVADFPASAFDGFEAYFSSFRAGVAASKSLQVFLPLFAG